MSLFKKNAENLSSYVVTQKVDGIKLNQNESPYDPAEDIKKNIFNRMLSEKWNRYPDGNCSELYSALSDYTGVAEERITVSNSSNELIQAAIYSCCNSGDSILSCYPTFSVYERVASLMGINCVMVDLKDDFSFDIDGIIEKLREVSLVILPSPANPAGSVLQPEDVRRILNKTDIPVVIDEAYFEFAGTTVQPLLEEFNNLIILRTFSKALGCAGLRIGYGLGCESVTEVLRKSKLPFSVSTFQQIAGCELLKERTIMEKQIAILCRNREELREQLKRKLDIDTPEAYANFVLLKYRDLSAEELYKELLKQGVLVRLFPEEVLRGYLRVTVGTSEENEILIKALKDIAELL